MPVFSLVFVYLWCFVIYVLLSVIVLLVCQDYHRGRNVRGVFNFAVADDTKIIIIRKVALHTCEIFE